MPRAVRRERRTDVVGAGHDVSAALRPRDKMLRAACTSCHGLRFAIDALADAELVQRSFNRLQLGFCSVLARLDVAVDHDELDARMLGLG